MMRHNHKYICLQIRMFMFEDLFKMFRRLNGATPKSAIQNNEKATVSSTSSPSSASFRYKKEESEKEALEHFKHVIKICPNRGHIFKNKLGNTWAAILKTSTASLLKVCTFSKKDQG